MAEAGTSANERGTHPVAISICERLTGLSLPSDCCIFTVPESLRRINEEAYTPRAVAIGPYHCDKPSLEPMENQKLLYLWTFLQAGDPNNEFDRLEEFKCHQSEYQDLKRLELERLRREGLARLRNDQVVRLEEYINIVKFRESDARSCYDKEIGLNSDRFAEMMLLDGIFVIQIFLMSRFSVTMLPNDRIFGRMWILRDVCSDMTLLENQIPFFVINDLFNAAFNTKSWYRPTLLVELMYKFFSRYMHVEELPEAGRPTEVNHIVDALRLSFLPSKDAAPHRINNPIKFSPRATELVAAGVKLRRGKSKCLFDIEFKDGVLKIPPLVFYRRTESLFLNIIAFEYCYYKKLSNKNLISYMAFMNQLVDTPTDTKLLMDKGIIENWLSNKEAPTDLIKAFSKETSMLSPEYYFHNLSIELIKYCQRPYNKWKATVKRNYILNTAVVLLLLTAIQTVCSILSLA